MDETWKRNYREFTEYPVGTTVRFKHTGHVATVIDHRMVSSRNEAGPISYYVQVVLDGHTRYSAAMLARYSDKICVVLSD
jgi:hypothetical protein